MYAYPSSNSRFQLVHLSFFPGVPSFHHHEDPSYHCKASTLFFSSFISFDLSFITGFLHRGSTWWFIKDSFHYSIVHQDFSRSYDPPSYTQKINMVLNTCLVLRSSSILLLHFEVQFLLPYLLRWCYVILDNLSSCFMIHMLSRMRYFKPIIFFLGVILCQISPKAFHWGCCYLWCLSMIQAFSISFLVKEVFHLFVDLKQAIVFVSGRISPQVLRCLHKPTKIISFLCRFFNNSILSFF